MNEEKSIAKQMNVNMQLLDLEMRVLARMMKHFMRNLLKILDKWRMIYINTNVSCVWWPIVVTEFFCIDRLKIVSMKIIFFNL